MSRNTDSDVSTDGGTGLQESDLDIFLQTDEDRIVTASAENRIERLLDVYIYTPFRISWTDWRARIGGTIMLFWILVGTIGVYIIPEPKIHQAERFTPPFTNWEFPLGSDAVGQGLGRQILHATPAMLQMALAGLLFSAGVGVIVGVTAGYVGGQLDRALMGLADVIIGIPGLPFIIVIAAIFPPREPFLVGVILAIDSWPGLARNLRSQVLTLREESYVESARAMGMRKSTIMVKDVMPSLAPYILINSFGAAIGVINASVGLYFLGILPFTTLNWGVIMNLAFSQGALTAPKQMGHWLFFPAIALASLNFGTILFSQGMDRVFNPRLRARHAKTVEDEETDETGDEILTTTSGTSMTQK